MFEPVTHSATRFLHVANGSCTTDLIAAASLPGQSSIWADPLYAGPVPENLDDDELIEVRARFLAGPEHGAHDVATALRDWRRVIAASDSYSELVLWFEHDLFDQLNLIQVLGWIRTHASHAKTVSLISVGAFPGHPDFKGLGELSPAELRSLLETRQPVSDQQFALAARAWSAFCQPTPQGLNELREGDTSALPFLAAAITRFLQEYPWTGDGLSRSERRLLELANAGPIDLLAAFPRMHDGERAYYITDSSLDELADTLSAASPPLLTRTRGEHHDSRGLRGSVTATEFGRSVLGGQRDRVAACGIDCWLGGVHLRDGAALWRWDDQRQRITAAESGSSA